MMRYDPIGHEVSPVDSMKHTLSDADSNVPYLAESSRKRTLADNDDPFMYRGNLRNQSFERSLQQDPGGFQVMNTQRRTGDMSVNNNIGFSWQNNAVGHHGNYQFLDINKFPTEFQKKDVHYQSVSLENLKSCTFSESGHSLVEKTHEMEVPKPYEFQQFPLSVASQAQVGKFHLSSSSYGDCTEKIMAASYDRVMLVPRNPNFSGDLSVYPFTTSSVSLKFSEFPQLSMVNKEMLASDGSNKILDVSNNRLALDVPKTGQNFVMAEFPQLRMVNNEILARDGSSNILDMSNNGLALDVPKSGQNFVMEGAKEITSFTRGSAESSGLAQRNGASGSYQYISPQIGSFNSQGPNLHARDKDQHGIFWPENSFMRDDVSLGCTRFSSGALGSGDNEARISESSMGSECENENGMFGEKPASVNADHAEKLAKSSASEPSLDLDGKGNSLSGKLAPTVSEKLWEGTLQLNTSTTVSVVASFKSGEKVTEINWSKHVEVKGKVRLEAFEKFIQELPRSRSRALMVISLCWNVGSSELGLTGMKEVAKGYKEGQRVGYAQLCPGIDLYVCPRSNTIITILARYGFFKGMAAVEEDQDSLIGCVIWRRNCPSSTSVPKKPERKKTPLLEQLVESPPESAASESAEVQTPLANAWDSNCTQTMLHVKEAAAASSPLILDTKTASRSNTDGNGMPSGNNLFNQSHQTISSINSVPPWATHSDLTAFPMQLPPSQKLSSALSGPSQMLPKAQHSSADPDDDDLPEFDFGFACGVRQPIESRFRLSPHKAHFLDDSQKNKIHVEESKVPSASMPPAPPVLRPTDVTQRPQAVFFMGHALDIHHGLSQSKAVEEVSFDCRQGAHISEPSSRLSSTKMGIDSVSIETKSDAMPGSLWNDDEDMPEWCPPNVQHSDLPPLLPLPRLAPLPVPRLAPLPVPRLAPQPLPTSLPPPLPKSGPLPPPLPLPTTFPRPQSSPVFQLTSSTTPSWIPTPSHFQARSPPPFNQGFSHGAQTRLMSPEQRHTNGFNQLSSRSSPERKPNQNTRRRTTGWDVKPSSDLSTSEGTMRHRTTGWDVKPEASTGGWRGQRRRH